jgi:hypothetical protein
MSAGSRPLRIEDFTPKNLQFLSDFDALLA